jgi:two-component system, NtrC family, response regulator HupR/HoxA
VKRTSLLSLAVEEFERRYLRVELIRHRWNRKQTAADLGISYRGLYYKLEKYGLKPQSESETEAVPA